MSALRWLQLMCLAWILWLPVSQPLVLYPALLGVAITSWALLIWQRLSVPGLVKIGVAVYFTFAIVYAIASFGVGNPGALQQSLLWLGVPLIWGPWALSLRGLHLRRTMQVLVVMTIVAGATVTWMGVRAGLHGPTGAYVARDGIPGWFSEVQQAWFTVAPDGQIEMAYLGLSSMVGLAPLFISLACLPGRSEWLPPRWLMTLAAMLAFVSCAVSGRRGLTLVVLIAPMICIAVALLMFVRGTLRGRAAKRYALGLGAVLVLVGCLVVSPLGTNIRVAATTVAAVAGVQTNQSDGSTVKPKKPKLEEADTIRIDQVSELVGEWRRSPWVGNGFGAVVESGYKRSEARPWTGFENQHLQVLMNVGVVGMSVLVLLSLLMGMVGLRALRVGRDQALLIASAVTLALLALANATNPYLQAPGHGWAAFLMLGVSVALLKNSTQGSSTAESSATTT